MRYIGSKANLLGFIDEVVCEHCHGARTFVDLFCGTAVVGRHFKTRGLSVTANDSLVCAYTLAHAAIQNNQEPKFAGLPFARATDPLGAAISHLNTLLPAPGFIARHYAPNGDGGRMYFSRENAARIDAIRGTLEMWRADGALTGDEFAVLLAALLDAVPSVSNTSGTYGAYLKFWEARSKKPLTLERPDILVAPGRHVAMNEDANTLVRRLECDILYLDPPYNARQYASNYHVLETIARWDMPEVSGITGLPRRDGERSRYCRRTEAAAALADIVCQARARHILLSYNTEGLIPQATLMEILARRGPVRVFERPYRRFRSDSDGPRRTYRADGVAERLYLVTT